MSFGAAFIQHLRDEHDHPDSRSDEELRAPLRTMRFNGPEGSGHAPVVAHSDEEAHETFVDLVIRAGGDPAEYDVHTVYPTDEEIEAVKEEDELAYSHMHRGQSRRKREKIRLAVEATRGDDE